jgi:phosphate transport system substrate-binding protein
VKLKKFNVLGAALAMTAATASLGLSQEVAKPDPAFPAYQPLSGVSESLSIVGSDTLNNLMTLRAEEFNKFYPNVKIQVEGKGSSTAPPALTCEFIKLVQSKQGQEVVVKDGYFPITADIAKKELDHIQ